MLIERNQNGSYAISKEFDGHLVTRQYVLMSKCEAVQEFADEFGLDISDVEFEFDELSDDAKEKARQWWREGENIDFDPEFVYDDAIKIGEILGIEIDSRINSGSTYSRPAIYYSGFWSQGGGACFEGSYRYAKGSKKAIREYAPKDKELHRIADGLAAIQKRNFYSLTASMSHSGRYYHSGCMSVSVDDSRHSYRYLDDDTAEDEITQYMRDFADWIYSRIESEYEYVMSNDNVDESIRINEYKFDIDGDII